MTRLSTLSRIALLGGALALILPGCAGLSRRERALKEKLTNHVYPLPPEELVQVLGKLLVEKGYQARPDPNAFFVDTLWKKSPSLVSSSRYEGEAAPVGQDKARIKITRFTERTGQQETLTPVDQSTGNSNQALQRPSIRKGRENEVRDWELELELLKTVDPAAAQQVETASAS
jgi:hypothetical protein